MTLDNFNSTHQCTKCRMKFYNNHELVNHVHKFCTSSGLNSFQGLEKYERQSRLSNGLIKNGKNIITSARQYQTDCNDVKLGKYGKEMEYQQQRLIHRSSTNNNVNKLSNMKNYLDQQRIAYQKKDNKNDGKDQKNQSFSYDKILNNSQLLVNRLSKLKKQTNNSLISKNNSDCKQKNDYHSQIYRPSKLLNNISIMDSNHKLSQSQQIQYAYQKLYQLDTISNMYERNNGNDTDFKQNIEKTRRFYEKMLQEHQQSGQQSNGEIMKGKTRKPTYNLTNPQDDQSHEQLPMKEKPLDLLDQQLIKKTKKKNKKIKTHTHQQNLSQIKKKQINLPPNNSINQQPFFFPTFYPPQQSPPQIVVVPYQQKQPSSSSPKHENNNKQLKYFHELMQIKNEQHSKLMKMLMNLKRVQKNSGVIQKPQHKYSLKPSIQLPQKQKTTNYYLEKSMTSNNLFNQQKVLLALQRQEIDELRLLSNLPQQLQKLKIKSVIKLIENRTQVQKQILKHKRQKFEEEQKNKQQEQKKKIKKSEWVDKGRKKIIQYQMKNILKSCQNQFSKKQCEECLQKHIESLYQKM